MKIIIEGSGHKYIPWTSYFYKLGRWHWEKFQLNGNQRGLWKGPFWRIPTQTWWPLYWDNFRNKDTWRKGLKYSLYCNSQQETFFSFLKGHRGRNAHLFRENPARIEFWALALPSPDRFPECPPLRFPLAAEQEPSGRNRGIAIFSQFPS